MNGAYEKHPAFNMAPSIKIQTPDKKNIKKQITCLFIIEISYILKTDVKILRK